MYGKQAMNHALMVDNIHYNRISYARSKVVLIINSS